MASTAHEFFIKQNDQLPVITEVLSGQDDTGAWGPIDLTGCNVEFHVKNRYGAPMISGTAGIEGSPTDGRVTYVWGPTDTAISGRYVREWEITYPNGKQLTVPNRGKYWITIEPSLDAVPTSPPVLVSWGATGPPGPTGASGPPGPSGATGPPGAGSTGATGPAGGPGANGAVGATGAGVTGATGAQGVAGGAGATGPTGPLGPAGGTATWRGTWAIGTAYVVNDVVAYAGSSYYCTASSTGNQPDTDGGAHWQLAAAGGAIGATGATGAQGVTGPQGTQGSAGGVGATGASGPQGVAGTAGATGATGPAGSAGLDGETGPPGAGLVAKGAWSGGTAYVVNDVVTDGGSTWRCILGHTAHQPPNLTYWELLASMGATGAAGGAGINGATGATGPAGGAGTNGATGATGSAGGSIYPIVSKTTTYTATTADVVILCATSSAWTLALYTAVGNDGRVLIIKKTSSDANALTIDPNGSQTIDGATTILIRTQNESVTLVYDGANWVVV
jgi:hypothetical protein